MPFIWFIRIKIIFFFPAPPLEIEAVFQESIHSILKGQEAHQFQELEKKELHLIQTLGQAKYVIATLTEDFGKKKPPLMK